MPAHVDDIVVRVVVLYPALQQLLAYLQVVAVTLDAFLQLELVVPLRPDLALELGLVIVYITDNAPISALRS